MSTGERREKSNLRFSVVNHSKPARERVGVVGVALTQTGQGDQGQLAGAGEGSVGVNETRRWGRLSKQRAHGPGPSSERLSSIAGQARELWAELDQASRGHACCPAQAGI